MLVDWMWPEVEEGGRSQTLLIPVGSTEQHGPHLPLSTDTDIAIAIADATARHSDDVVVAPAVSYGSSGEHQEFAGTLSIGSDSLESLLVELSRSAAFSFGRCILVSTHGGNRETVERVVRRLQEERRHVNAWFPSWDGDAHAGRTETSLMLAIHPERVDLTRAEPGNETPIDELMPLLRARGVRAASRNGVLGNPDGATATEGRLLLDAAAVRLRLRITGR